MLLSGYRCEGGVSSRNKVFGSVDGSKVLEVKLLLPVRLCLKRVHQRHLSK